MLISVCLILLLEKIFDVKLLCTTVSCCYFSGGDRANIIHYIANNQLIADGDMVLMDAGCECHGYTSDITRTWPINGKFR